MLLIDIQYPNSLIHWDTEAIDEAVIKYCYLYSKENVEQLEKTA